MNDDQHIRISEEGKADFSLSPTFPVAAFQTDLATKPRGVNNWHWHEELQFCIVDQGELYVSIPGREILLRRGEGYFIQSGIPHTTRAVAPEYAVYRCLNVDPLFLFAHPGGVLDQRYYFPYKTLNAMSLIPLSTEIGWEQDATTLLEKVFDALKQESFGFELMICSQLLLLWKLILEHLNSHPVSGKSIRKEATQMLRYLRENYFSDSCIADVPNAVHISAAECCRIFKRSYGCTMTSYLTAYRLQRASEMLIKTDLSISEIAYKAGFHSLSYFTKLFREQLNATPSAYRRSKAFVPIHDAKSYLGQEACL